MDPSSLIFVALFVAWAVYLVPKALEHHEESLRSRAVSSFSRSMRVLARREPVDKGRTDLVTERRPAPDKKSAPTERPAPAEKQVYDVVPVRLTPAQLRARRAAARRATRRRRTVLSVLLLAVAAVAALVILDYVDRIWLGAPIALVVAWLVLCRVMVRKEHAVVTRRVPRAASQPPAAAVELDPDTGEIVAVLDADGNPTGSFAAVAEAEPETAAEPEEAPQRAEGEWDPVEAPLPTYVAKPPAPRRTVRTIDLDSTGVWSSGRNASDSALAREAEESEREAKRAEDNGRRAAGS
ncbi:hypothetical protein [Nocardioides sp. KR10-350]|uniref:divisome protein SepX/GlpR n=1 Tax=Nocardioides cheoyonin TaxID=3156615 RepID=UPI0032B4FFB7